MAGRTLARPVERGVLVAVALSFTVGFATLGPALYEE
jgi:hypothetical protein